VCSTKTHGYLTLHDAWQRMAAGELSEAAADLLMVKNHFVKSGRLRSAWEILLFRGIALYLHGNISECAKVSAEVEEVTALMCLDPAAPAATTIQWWNKVLLSLSLIHHESVDGVGELLKEIRGLKIQSGDLKWTDNPQLHAILFQSLNAYTLCRQGQIEEALTRANEATKLLATPLRTLFIGITHLATSLLSITAVECWRRLQDQECPDSESEAKVMSLLAGILALTQTFASTVPFAAPRAKLCEGLLLCIKGGREGGRAHLHQAEILAVKANMPLERALSLYYGCVFSQQLSPQDALLSESIFTSVGADHEANLARQLLRA